MNDRDWEQTMTYTISRLLFRGEGLAVSDEDSHKIRIANVLPGEVVSASEPQPDETDKHARRRFAVLNKVIQPSPDRCEAVCAHWRACPACQFQCMHYRAQTQFKKENWIRLLQKFCTLPEQIAFLPAIRQIAYRCRAEALVLSRTLGITARPELLAILDGSKDCSAIAGDERIIPLQSCVLQVPELNDLITTVQEHLADFNLPQNLRISFEARDLPENEINRRIVLYPQPEFAECTRKAGLMIVQMFGIPVILQVLPPHGSHVYPKPEALSQTPWYGYDTDDCGHVLYALKGAWTPVNPDNAHLIRQTIGQIVKDLPAGKVLEIGCGCGTHTSLFKDHDYTGIDASWPAIQSAQYNAAQYNWQDTNFYTDTADHYLVKRYYAGRRADIILMHSNRLPYSQQVAEYCKKFGAHHIIIVSPTAFALARECQYFEQLGYQIRSLTLCDTMPYTYHMMGVSHLVLV